jgi:hypothetical protein
VHTPLSKEEKERKLLKIVAYKLAAHRAFLDYTLARSCFTVEPEHFIEEWTSRFVPGMYSEESKAFNDEFMQLLTEKVGK